MPTIPMTNLEIHSFLQRVKVSKPQKEEQIIFCVFDHRQLKNITDGWKRY